MQEGYLILCEASSPNHKTRFQEAPNEGAISVGAFIEQRQKDRCKHAKPWNDVMLSAIHNLSTSRPNQVAQKQVGLASSDLLSTPWLACV